LSDRLDNVTWSNNHLALVLEPELEEWLWHSQQAILTHLDIQQTEMNQWLLDWAKGKPLQQLLQQQPKEAFEQVVSRKKDRKPQPRDFEKIASKASLVAWRNSASFHKLVTTLQSWFPAE
ncbi:MAG: hypothetical protein HQL56_00920, partial [Magnetococcales bacterium]|nr:hypothetical protein [Magnetococcales bacterium]